MTKTGVFYGSTTGNTEQVAKQISVALGADLHNVTASSATDLKEYDTLIFGLPTWGIGELQDDWADFIEQLDLADLSGKRVAIFGLGDQEQYSDSFVDAMREVYDKAKACGATLVGSWPTDDYEFEESQALVDDQFVGLVLDEDNQTDQTAGRIARWAEQIQTA